MNNVNLKQNQFFLGENILSDGGLQHQASPRFGLNDKSSSNANVSSMVGTKKFGFMNVNSSMEQITPSK